MRWRLTIEHVKAYAIQSDSTYKRGRVMELQARVWYGREKYEAAKSEALQAVDVFRKLGVARFVGCTRKLLQWI